MKCSQYIPAAQMSYVNHRVGMSIGYIYIIAITLS